MCGTPKHSAQSLWHPWHVRLVDSQYCPAGQSLLSVQDFRTEIEHRDLKWSQS